MIFDRICNDSIGPNCVFLVFCFSCNIHRFWYILLMNLVRSFSSRMSVILYFQTWKFSTHSSLSTILVLADIFYLELGKCPKMKMLKIKFETYQEVCLAEASSLVCLDLRKSNFCSSNLDLRIYGLVFLVFWYFWYF